MEAWLRDHCDEQLADRDIAIDQRLLSVMDSRLNFRPTESDASYVDRLIIVSTTGGSGCCGCPHDDIVVDTAEILSNDGILQYGIHSCVEIAYTDALLGSDHERPKPTITLEGSIQKKAQARAEIITHEIQSLVDGLKLNHRPKIGMVGVAGSIVTELTRKNFDVIATEFDEALIGQDVGGAFVVHGSQTPEVIERSDVALVTGMTIATETLGSILEAAKAGKTPLIFFAQTGINILNSIDFPTPTIIVAERFPHYMWPGATHISVDRYTSEDTRHAATIKPIKDKVVQH